MATTSKRRGHSSMWPFGKEAPRRANHDALLLSGHAKFRERGCVFFYCAGPNFHKRQRLAIVADKAQFTFDAAWRVVLCDRYVPVTPQIPISVGLTAHTGAPRLQLFSASGFQPCRTEKIPFFAQTPPRRP